MNNKSLNIVVFSRDVDFVKMCINKNYGTAQKGPHKFHISISADDVAALADCDLVIYDIDLANNDSLLATEDILHLKYHLGTKPLFLVGERAAVTDAFSDENNNRNVSRAIAKPVLRSALDLHINRVASKASLLRVTESQPKNNLGFLARMFDKNVAGQKPMANR